MPAIPSSCALCSQAREKSALGWSAFKALGMSLGTSQVVQTPRPIHKHMKKSVHAPCTFRELAEPEVVRQLLGSPSSTARVGRGRSDFGAQ